MMGLGSNDVRTQVFPLVQYIHNVIAMRRVTTTLTQSILEGLTTLF